MHEELERAIKVLLGKITAAVQPDQALRFTQSASYLAHVMQVVEELRKDRKTKGTSASGAG